MSKKNMFVFSSYMKISNNRNFNIQNRPTFSGQRICNVGLKRVVSGVNQYMPAYFTRLTKEDIDLIDSARSTWGMAGYASVIVSDFLRLLSRQRTPKEECKRFFMIEEPYSLNPIDKIRALAEASIDEDALVLSLLQSATSINPKDKVSGAGTTMIYGLTKIAQKMGLNEIRLTSANYTTDEWYNKLGFSSDIYGNSFDMILSSRDFNRFQKIVENKYKFKGE